MLFLETSFILQLNKPSVMKKILLAFTLLLAATTFSFAQMKKSSNPMHTKMVHTKYTCKMHPEVVSNKPGKCSTCGMKLVAMKAKPKKMQKPMGEMKM